MATIKDSAMAYEPPQTKNIADLPSVDVSEDIIEKEYRKEDDTMFTVNVLERDGEDYRVPASVLKALKVIMVEKPDLKTFKVSKTGEGLKTQYTVITLT